VREPKAPRDLIWCQARVSLKTGTGGDVFLPALYPNSHANADDQVKLGRMTDWVSAEGAPVRGVGAREFLVDDDAMKLVDVRELRVP